MLGGAVIASIISFTIIPPESELHAQVDLTAPVTAEINNAQVGVTGSPRSITNFAIGGFSAVVLNGEIQNATSEITPFTVTDPTGTGAGWNVTMEADPLTLVGSTETLPTGSLTVKAPTITALEGSAAVDQNMVVKGGAIDGAGQTIISAAPGAGMGSYSVSFLSQLLDGTTTNANDALSLRLLPKDVKSGTYTTTIRVTINSGPGLGAQS